MSAWFLHNKIFASLTHRSLLVIPFPTVGAGPWNWCRAELSTSFHKKNPLFSASPFSSRRDPNLFLDQKFGAKGDRLMHKSILSSRDFQAICLAGKFAPTFQPPGAPGDSQGAMAA